MKNSETPEKYDLNEYRLEDFNRDRAKAGEAVCTKEGYPVEIDWEESLGPKEPEHWLPMRGWVVIKDHKYRKSWTNKGRNSFVNENDYDLFHPVEIVDTSKVLDINSMIEDEGLAIRFVDAKDVEFFVNKEGEFKSNKTKKFEIWIGYSPFLKDQKKVILTGTQEAGSFKDACRILFTERYRNTTFEEMVQMLISRDELYALTGNVFETREEAERDLSEKSGIPLEEIIANRKRSLLSITLEEFIDFMKLARLWVKVHKYETTLIDYGPGLQGIEFRETNVLGPCIKVTFNDAPGHAPIALVNCVIHPDGWYKVFKYLESRGFDLDAAFGLS